MGFIRCPRCLQKHLALCKSFCREAMDGHGEGGVPDHRIDIEGELSNAEMHASVIDAVFTLKVRRLRRDMQARKFSPEEGDLAALDTLYLYADVFHAGNAAPAAEGSQEPPEPAVPDSVREAYAALPQVPDPASDVSKAFRAGGCGCSRR